MELFAAGDHSAAFAAFTEAIRLCPTSAVYHSNRSAAALKLGKPDIAADDAENALQRDSGYLRAALRAGQARLQARQAEQAGDHFRRAAALDPGNAVAAKGLRQVEELVQLLEEEDAANRAHAEAGARPALPLSAVPEEAAALQLYSAEHMLTFNSNNEALKCGKVEALIACRRYPDALAACQDLRAGGLERAYLEAEALWRDGDVAAALATLDTATETNPKCVKVAALRAFLLPLQAAVAAVDASLDGIYLDAMEASSRALSQLDPEACCGLVRALLRRRADAAAARRLWAEAVADLDRAVELDPGDAAALRLRADVHKRSGAYLEYFLDVHRLKKALPGAAGLSELLIDAARLCEGDRGGDGRGGGGGTVAGGPASAFDALGLSRRASAADVRRAYLRLAAEWHPDKWATSSEEEREAAAQKFIRVQAAYEALAPT